MIFNFYIGTRGGQNNLQQILHFKPIFVLLLLLPNGINQWTKPSPTKVDSFHIGTKGGQTKEACHLIFLFLSPSNTLLQLIAFFKTYPSIISSFSISGLLLILQTLFSLITFFKTYSSMISSSPW